MPEKEVTRKPKPKKEVARKGSKERKMSAAEKQAVREGRAYPDTPSGRRKAYRDSSGTQKTLKQLRQFGKSLPGPAGGYFDLVDAGTRKLMGGVRKLSWRLGRRKRAASRQSGRSGR